MKLILTRVKLAFEDKEEFIKWMAILGGALFFATALNTAIFVRVFTILGFNQFMAVQLKWCVPLILCLPLIVKRRKKLKIFFYIYIVVAIYFAISILLNMEYLDIYFREKYGVHKVFLPSGGMFALLYITLLYDKENYEDLRLMFFLVAIMMFAMSTLQYIAALKRGFWLYTDAKGVEKKIRYSLDFGFNMAFAVNLFLASFLYKKHWLKLIPVVAGYYMIITAGNRMALFLSFIFLILYFVYILLNKNIEKKLKIKELIITFCLMLALATTFYATIQVERSIYSAKLKEVRQGKISREEAEDFLPARNINFAKSEKIFAANGRDRIHQLVLEGLKGHEFFGLGAFGDRPLVTKEFIWGHSHGIHIEIWSNFGIFLGVPFVLLLANTFFTMLSRRRDFISILYFMFVGTAALHLTSLSMWLEHYIWSCMAVAFLVMKKEDFWIYQIYKKFVVKSKR